MLTGHRSHIQYVLCLWPSVLASLFQSMFNEASDCLLCSASTPTGERGEKMKNARPHCSVDYLMKINKMKATLNASQEEIVPHYRMYFCLIASLGLL